MQQPTLSKRAQKRLERQAALAQAIAAARPLLLPPPELHASGIVKTRCWVALHDKLSRQMHLKHPNTQRIENLTWNMRLWKDFDPDQAQACLARLTAPKPIKAVLQVAA